MQTSKYEHHGRLVSVIDKFKGTHRENCLCYACDKMKPGQSGHCPIASALYKNCVEFGVVTPVWECPDFQPKE